MSENVTLKILFLHKLFVVRLDFVASWSMCCFFFVALCELIIDAYNDAVHFSQRKSLLFFLDKATNTIPRCDS